MTLPTGIHHDNCIGDISLRAPWGQRKQPKPDDHTAPGELGLGAGKGLWQGRSGLFCAVLPEISEPLGGSLGGQRALPNHGRPMRHGLQIPRPAHRMIAAAPGVLFGGHQWALDAGGALA